MAQNRLGIDPNGQAGVEKRRFVLIKIIYFFKTYHLFFIILFFWWSKKNPHEKCRRTVSELIQTDKQASRNNDFLFQHKNNDFPWSMVHGRP